MNISEFKAWFEGFCESIDGAPTPEQFAKIKAKVATLNDAPKYTGIRGAGSPRWAPAPGVWLSADGPSAETISDMPAEPRSVAQQATDLAGSGRAWTTEQDIDT